MIGELPTGLDLDDLPPALVDPASRGRQVLHLPLGIGDHDLRPRGFDLEPGQHALIVGPARSGRSTALAVMARSVLVPPVGANSAYPLGRVIALTPRPSPLRTWPGVAAAADVDQLLAELVARRRRRAPSWCWSTTASWSTTGPARWPRSSARAARAST